jgi:peptidoglycan/LPS O-acetylase OafA/YrhL
MGRNLYILAATLGLFALISCAVAFTNIAQQPGSPGDQSLWQTMGLGLLVVALIVALAGILSSLFEQAERRADEARRATRRKPHAE